MEEADSTKETLIQVTDTDPDTEDADTNGHPICRQTADTELPAGRDESLFFPYIRGDSA